MNSCYMSLGYFFKSNISEGTILNTDLLGLKIDSVPFLSDLKVKYKTNKLVAMENWLLSNSESMCKFFFCLSRIFLYELLQFLVFKFFRLTSTVSVGKVKITIAKFLESLFTRLMCYRIFSYS